MQSIGSFILLFLLYLCLTVAEGENYKQMQWGSFCPNQESVLISAVECEKAARYLGIQDELKEVDNSEGFPGCAHSKAEDSGGVEWMGRSQVIFNRNTNSRTPRNAELFAAICNLGNNKETKLDENCIEKNTNTQHRDTIGSPTPTRTWKECSDKCRTKPFCKYWTWHTKEFGLKCVLLTNFRSKAPDKNTISGTKESKDCDDWSSTITPQKDTRQQQVVNKPDKTPPVTTPPVTIKPKNCIEKNKDTQRRNQMGLSTITRKWHQCSDKCRVTDGCTYWTWYKPTAPKDKALKCSLLSAKENNGRVEIIIKINDKNAISGKPGGLDCDAISSEFGEQGVSVTTMFMVLYSIVAVLLLLAVCLYNLHSLVTRGKSS